MFTLSRKAKQFLIVVAKLLIVGGAFYFVYDRLSKSEHLEWVRFTEAFGGTESLGLVILLLVLTFLNRFLEILKWQNLASVLRPLSLAGATEQVLAAVTAALFTPNGIGEYAAKALYYEKQQAKFIVFLNLICNGIQLILAVVCGLAGLIVFNVIYEVLPNSTLLLIMGVLALVAGIVFSARRITIKGYSLQKLAEKTNSLPAAVHKKNIWLALARYLVLMHQYYFLFLAFDVSLPYPVMMATIAGVYFLGSSLPTFQLLDFAVKGSVAVFFFGVLGVNEWIVVFTTTAVWFLNVVVPVTIGSYYVFRFKSVRLEATLPKG